MARGRRSPDSDETIMQMLSDWIKGQVSSGRLTAEGGGPIGPDTVLRGPGATDPEPSDVFIDVVNLDAHLGMCREPVTGRRLAAEVMSWDLEYWPDRLAVIAVLLMETRTEVLARSAQQRVAAGPSS